MTVAFLACCCPFHLSDPGKPLDPGTSFESLPAAPGIRQSASRRITGSSRSTWLGPSASSRVGPRRGVRGFTRSVSSARPPHRTCPSPSIRLSTGSCRIACPWCGDLGAPVSVANDRYLQWPEHLGLAVANLPSWEVAAAQGSPVQPVVPFAHPPNHSPPGVVVEVAERLRGHAVSEVVTPSPQHPVEQAQQVGERSMLASVGDRSDLVHHRGQGLL